MNLPTSSSDSDRSKTAVKTRPRESRKSEQKAARDQDEPLKLMVASALATSGYYSRINVGLSATSARGLSDVTDIDVLGLKHDLTFNQNAIAVTCKSGASRSLSPAREVFYLRGVLDYFRAESGVAAFVRKPIPSHLRDLGRRLNVLVLSGVEVDEWCKSLKNGLPAPGYFDGTAYQRYLNAWSHLPNPELLGYLRSDYWFHFDFRNLQNLIGHFRKLASKITVRQDWLDIVALDVAAHLCLTVFDLCHQIRMMGIPSVVETTSAYLFGGSVSFRARRDLYLRVQQLLASTGVLRSGGPSLPPLEPVYTPGLSELVLRYIERPHAAVLVPQVLQDTIWQRVGAKGLAVTEDKNQLAAEKLAQDLLDFLGAATGAKWIPKI
jgi:hypothetical protein